MHFETWLVYLAACIGLSASPGPNGLLALTHGALHGRRLALFTIFGGSLGFVMVIALSMFGIGALLESSLVWLTVLKWLGGAYLVWLGIQVWRSPPLDLESGSAQRAVGSTGSAAASSSQSVRHCPFARDRGRGGSCPRAGRADGGSGYGPAWASVSRSSPDTSSSRMPSAANWRAMFLR